jgi:hypothetical protein
MTEKCKPMTHVQLVCSDIHAVINMLKSTKKLEHRENVDYLIRDAIAMLQMTKVEIRQSF